VPDSIYFAFVQRLAQLGITLGCQSTPPLFCPDQSVSHGQMAAFMIRSWMLLNNITTLTYPTTPYFTDVPTTDIFFMYVQKIAQLGFWTGCTATTYCRNDAVTRDQAAPMILRSMLGAP
jgi:S-layer homology domain